MMAIAPTDLIDLIESQRFGVEYQPIIHIEDRSLFAYEALARFYDRNQEPLRPDLVYASLHDSPISLFQVEYQQKRLQLAHAPRDVPTFVNLDQDSYFSSGIQGDDNPFLTLFKQHNDKDIIVELIENSELNDAIMSLSMIDSMAKTGLSTAIDDVFNPQCMISTSVIQMVDFIKLDKQVVKKRNDEEFLLLVKMMVQYAKQTNKRIILEGIESEADLDFARELGVDLVQGFLYRERFVCIRN